MSPECSLRRQPVCKSTWPPRVSLTRRSRWSCLLFHVSDASLLSWTVSMKPTFNPHPPSPQLWTVCPATRCGAFHVAPFAWCVYVPTGVGVSAHGLQLGLLGAEGEGPGAGGTVPHRTSSGLLCPPPRTLVSPSVAIGSPLSAVGPALQPAVPSAHGTATPAHWLFRFLRWACRVERGRERVEHRIHPLFPRYGHCGAG